MRSILSSFITKMIESRQLVNGIITSPLTTEALEKLFQRSPGVIDVDPSGYCNWQERREFFRFFEFQNFAKLPSIQNLLVEVNQVFTQRPWLSNLDTSDAPNRQDVPPCGLSSAVVVADLAKSTKYAREEADEGAVNKDRVVDINRMGASTLQIFYSLLEETGLQNPYRFFKVIFGGDGLTMQMYFPDVHIFVNLFEEVVKIVNSIIQKTVEDSEVYLRFDHESYIPYDDDEFQEVLSQDSLGSLNIICREGVEVESRIRGRSCELIEGEVHRLHLPPLLLETGDFGDLKEGENLYLCTFCIDKKSSDLSDSKKHETLIKLCDDLGKARIGEYKLSDYVFLQNAYIDGNSIKIPYRLNDALRSEAMIAFTGLCRDAGLNFNINRVNNPRIHKLYLMTKSGKKIPFQTLPCTLKDIYTAVNLERQVGSISSF
jgi:hypothetical protein